MKKVGFFKSIHLKLVLIYVLLILIAMQLIGVYFVQQLESRLVENFNSSLRERAHLLAYNVEKEMAKDPNGDELQIPQDIQNLLLDFASKEISEEVQVIDKNRKVIGTSNINNQEVVGKRTTEVLVKRVLVLGEKEEKNVVDPKSGNRMRVLVVPLKSNEETIGVIYVLASMGNIYEQMREINNILAAGTAIALIITALLGIFLARTITRPMADMRRQAIVMAKGDFSRKVHVYGTDEIGQLAETFNDLTQKLKEAQATTEGERRKLSSVIAHMTDGVIAANDKGDIILMNTPAKQMLGVEEDEVVGIPLLDMLRIHPDEVSIKRLLADTNPIILDFSTKDQPLLLKASFSLIQTNADETPTGVITVLNDVTEQEKIERERREFVANVSHELRTPLTTMRSYLEALTDGAWKDEDIAPKFLGVTQTETERMIRLVNSLLQLSKLDNKDYRMNLEKVDFISLFNKVIDRFEMTKEQNVTFKRDVPVGYLPVQIDKDKLTQVLDNIISNALKYSPEGGTINYQLEFGQTYLKVSVYDEGVGIPKQYIDKIFDRFYRVDKARTRKLGGTGLGLAIAKEIVELHRGEIWAESTEGKGTTIHFTLPLKKEGKRDED